MVIHEVATMILLALAPPTATHCTERAREAPNAAARARVSGPARAVRVSSGDSPAAQDFAVD